MATSGNHLTERLKNEALRLGTRGVGWVVEGTATALRTLDRLRERLHEEQRRTGARWPAGEDSVMESQRLEPALYRPPPARPVADRLENRVRAKARATAELVLEEARAAKERLEKAQPAPRPLKVSAGAEDPAKRRTASKGVRTQGRKTTADASAPKRLTARKEGFKAKRGQKHGH